MYKQVQRARKEMGNAKYEYLSKADLPTRSFWHASRPGVD